MIQSSKSAEAVLHDIDQPKTHPMYNPYVPNAYCYPCDPQAAVAPGMPPYNPNALPADASIQQINQIELIAIAQEAKKPVHLLDQADVRSYIKRRKTLSEASGSNAAGNKHPKIKEYLSQSDKDNTPGSLRIDETDGKFNLTKITDPKITLPMWIRAAERICVKFYESSREEYQTHVNWFIFMWDRYMPKQLLEYDDQFRQMIHNKEHHSWAVPVDYLFDGICRMHSRPDVGDLNKNKNKYERSKYDKSKSWQDTSGGNKRKSAMPCKNFNSKTGCKFGSNCGFFHGCANPNCGSTDHNIFNCPLLK